MRISDWSSDVCSSDLGVNGSIEGDEIVYRDYADVSVAVSAPQGLVVPVVRDADKLSFAQVEKTIADFGKRAKDGTQIGSASCRERVCQYVSISVVAVELKKKKIKNK